MILTDFKDDKVTYYIDLQTSKYLNKNSSACISVLTNESAVVIADTIIENWNYLLESFELIEGEETIEVNDEGEEIVVVGDPYLDVDAIVLAADNHFNSMTDLSMLLTTKIDVLSVQIEKVQYYSNLNLLLIVFFLASYFINTSITMSKSRQLASISTLDASTGLYNRSKCHEIFNDRFVISKDSQTIIVVIDLNDLKKTNDLHGHQMGDELISTFANILKKSVNVHDAKPFLGRYGGDEFVVYYKDVKSEDEITAFIDELAKNTDEINQVDSNTFKVSFAIGYAVKELGREGFTTRQLFDEADENMYENKKEMKNNRANQEVDFA